MTYLSGVPRQVPEGRIVVHNHVRPVDASGARIPAARVALGFHGFRAWTEPIGKPMRVACRCGWAPHLAEHYRVKLNERGKP